jgi:hypothetical protein
VTTSIQAHADAVLGLLRADAQLTVYDGKVTGDVTPSVAGRACFPIRWVEGTQVQRDEATLSAVFDNVDVYSLVTVPG